MTLKQAKQNSKVDSPSKTFKRKPLLKKTITGKDDRKANQRKIDRILKAQQGTVKSKTLKGLNQADFGISKTSIGARDSLGSKLEAKLMEERQYFTELVSQMGGQIKELQKVVSELRAEKHVKPKIDSQELKANSFNQLDQVQKSK